MKNEYYKKIHKDQFKNIQLDYHKWGFVPSIKVKLNCIPVKLCIFQKYLEKDALIFLAILLFFLYIPFSNTLY